MVKRIVGWLVLVPLCALLIVFALANRQVVALNFNPFVSPDLLQTPGYGVPLFLVLYVVLLIGVMLGGIATWFAQSQHRQRERHWRREAQALNGELEGLRKSQRQTGTTPMTEVDDLLELR
jgi:hypothetical protein